MYVISLLERFCEFDHIAIKQNWDSNIIVAMFIQFIQLKDVFCSNPVCDVLKKRQIRRETQIQHYNWSQISSQSDFSYITLTSSLRANPPTAPDVFIKMTPWTLPGCIIPNLWIQFKYLLMFKRLHIIPSGNVSTRPISNDNNSLYPQLIQHRDQVEAKILVILWFVHV